MDADFSDLVGVTLTSIVCRKDDDANDQIVFTANDGRVWEMYHWQDCCESVYIEDIAGNLDDLLHAPILQADAESNSSGESGDYSATWTFYKLATVNGHVTIRWYGSSNGYYSESVSFYCAS